MPRVSHEVLKEIAIVIRPHATEFIEQRGQVTDEEVRGLVARYTTYHITSDLSIAKIQEFLVDA